MNPFINKTLFIFCAAIVFIIAENSFAQQLLGINDEIGGGGTTTTEVNQSDDSMLYIVGGVVIAGIILYAIFRDKDEIKKETDTTSVLNGNNDLGTVIESGDSIKSSSYKLPVNFYFNVHRLNNFTDDRKYVFGLRFSL
jgi:hypothetical protein